MFEAIIIVLLILVIIYFYWYPYHRLVYSPIKEISDQQDAMYKSYNIMRNVICKNPELKTFVEDTKQAIRNAYQHGFTYETNKYGEKVNICLNAKTNLRYRLDHILRSLDAGLVKSYYYYYDNATDINVYRERMEGDPTAEEAAIVMSVGTLVYEYIVFLLDKMCESGTMNVQVILNMIDNQVANFCSGKYDNYVRANLSLYGDLLHIPEVAIPKMAENTIAYSINNMEKTYPVTISPGVVAYPARPQPTAVYTGDASAPTTMINNDQIMSDYFNYIQRFNYEDQRILEEYRQEISNLDNSLNYKAMEIVLSYLRGGYRVIDAVGNAKNDIYSILSVSNPNMAYPVQVVA
jgi:hypothetical protein